MQAMWKLEINRAFFWATCHSSLSIWQHSSVLSGWHILFWFLAYLWISGINPINENHHQVCIRLFSGIYRFNILTVYCALRPTFNDGALTPRISLAGTLARLPKRSRIVSNSSRQMVRFSKAKFRPVTEFTAISLPLYRLIILRKFSFVPTFWQRLFFKLRWLNLRKIFSLAPCSKKWAKSLSLESSLYSAQEINLSHFFGWLIKF